MRQPDDDELEEMIHRLKAISGGHVNGGQGTIWFKHPYKVETGYADGDMKPWYRWTCKCGHGAWVRNRDFADMEGDRHPLMADMGYNLKGGER